MHRGNDSLDFALYLYNVAVATVVIIMTGRTIVEMLLIDGLHIVLRNREKDLEVLMSSKY